MGKINPKTQNKLPNQKGNPLKTKNQSSSPNKPNVLKGKPEINKKNFKPNIKKNFNGKKFPKNLIKNAVENKELTNDVKPKNIPVVKGSFKQKNKKLNNQGNNSKQLNSQKDKKLNNVQASKPEQSTTQKNNKVNVKETNNSKPLVIQKNKKDKKLNSPKNVKTEENNAAASSPNKKEGSQSPAKKNKNEVKVKHPKKFLALASQFDEEAFNNVVNTENIKPIVEQLKKIVSEEIENSKKQKVFTDYKYMLDITYFNIPQCPKRTVKLKLKHSLLTEDDDVILFVKDKESKKDFEKTVQYYEDLLRSKDVKGIKTIMPFSQLRKEYVSYESKIKLSNMYDHYICDGAITGHLFGFLGRKFQKTRCTLYSVRMYVQDLAKEFEKVMCKTCFKQGEKGPVVSVPIANHTMNPEQITDNILEVVAQLKTLFPGGLPNIRNMHLKINLTGTSSLPIYISVAKPPAEVPNIVGPKEKKLRELADGANEVLTKFHMSSDGKLTPLSDQGINDKKRKQQQKQEVSEPKSKKAKQTNVKQNLVKVQDQDTKKVGSIIKVKKENEDESDESDELDFDLLKAENSSEEDGGNENTKSNEDEADDDEYENEADDDEDENEADDDKDEDDDDIDNGQNENDDDDVDNGQNENDDEDKDDEDEDEDDDDIDNGQNENDDEDKDDEDEDEDDDDVDNGQNESDDEDKDDEDEDEE